MSDRRELLHAGMDSGSVLELHCRTGGLALGFYFAAERRSAGIEITLHAADFEVVGLIGTAFEAGSETHLHLRVHAAGESGVGIQVEVAAAHLEEVEGAVEEFFSGRSRSERPIVDGSPVQPADLARNVSARIGVIEIQADERGRTKLEALAVVAGEDLAQSAVEQETALEIRAGDGVFDGACLRAQVETLAAFLGGAEKAHQALLQVRGFGDVGLGALFAAKDEDARSC